MNVDRLVVDSDLVRETAPRLEVRVVDLVLADDPPRFPHAQQRTRRHHLHFLATLQVFAKEARAWSWRRANPVGALYMLSTRPGLRPLAVISFLGLVANNALPTMAVLYVINRYGWSLRQLSYMLGAMGLCSALVGGLLTGPVVRRIGERRALMAGLCFGVTGFALFGVAPTGAVLLCAIPLMSLRGLADPALTALMTRRVLPSEQGRLQGAVSSLLGIAGLIGPSVYSESYAYLRGAASRLEPARRMPFLICGAAAFAGSTRAWRHGGLLWRRRLLSLRSEALLLRPSGPPSSTLLGRQRTARAN